MNTIHLTDAQRDTLAACGLIVVDGELRDDANPEQCRHCNTLPCAEHAVAPEGWRILTEPCDTCKGLGFKHWTDYPSGATVASCAVCGWDIDINLAQHVDPEQYERYHSGRERPFKLDHTTYPAPCPNPDCVGGRPVVTLTATCPDCRGWGYHSAGSYGGRSNPEQRKCKTCATDGKVTLGRFTIPALLPVVADVFDASGPVVHVPKEGWCHYVGREGIQPLALDPLPQPGQFIARPKAVV